MKIPPSILVTTVLNGLNAKNALAYEETGHSQKNACYKHTQARCIFI